MKNFPRNLINDALTNADMEWDQLVADYSGKAMYGSECFGIKMESGYGQLAKVMVALGSMAATSYCDDDQCDACDLDDLVGAVYELAGSVRVDDLGHGQIAYFPGWRLG